jgi:hypothetical protein
MSVQAAMAGVGARYYSRRRRKSTSEDRFPGGRSRTPDEVRVVAAPLRKHSVADLKALRKRTLPEV